MKKQSPQTNLNIRNNLLRKYCVKVSVQMIKLRLKSTFQLQSLRGPEFELQI